MVEGAETKMESRDNKGEEGRESLNKRNGMEPGVLTTVNKVNTGQGTQPGRRNEETNWEQQLYRTRKDTRRSQ